MIYLRICLVFRAMWLLVYSDLGFAWMAQIPAPVYLCYTFDVLLDSTLSRHFIDLKSVSEGLQIQCTEPIGCSFVVLLVVIF
jgi:hypothetical protein